MFITKNKIIKFFLVIFLFLFFSKLCLAQGVTCSGVGQNSPDGQICEFQNPLGDKVNDPNVFIGTVINKILGIVGSIALVMFVYGGFTWMLAGGNTEKVQKAKSVLVWSTLGLIAIFSAYTAVKFLFENVK